MMNRHGAVDLDWGDGTYTFRLGIGEIEEVEEVTDRSMFQLVEALNPVNRTARLKDIRAVIRCGLIGGGMSPVDALAKVRRYLDDRPLTESLTTAFAVAAAAIVRTNGDEAGKSEAGKPSSNEPTSPNSTEPAS
jgi:hypothetical protein